jgi:uridine kinase
MDRVTTRERSAVLGQLADEIVRLPADPFLRVAIDRFDGAGKTIFADELGEALTTLNRHVVRATIDKFHNPKSIRYARGRKSPEGFYRDSYNLSELNANLLAPLGPGGNGKFRSGVFDVNSDSQKVELFMQAAPGSILLLDGIFLHRPELLGWWNWSVWLDVSPEISFARIQNRDGKGSADPNADSNIRYRDGQRLYVLEANPRGRASRIIDNNDLRAPTIRR